MAMTLMRSGICTAGYVNEPHPASGLRWVRPVKEFGSLLLGDMSDRDGRVVQINDVIHLNLLQPRPDPTHAEDWLTDFVRQRPVYLRRLSSEKRAQFLSNHVDRRPADVLYEHSRSLCLVQPERVWANFFLDHYSGKYEARLGFTLAGLDHVQAGSPRGLPVTDLKWRALGREWLAQAETGRLTLEHDELHGRLDTDALYLTVGLSRSYKGEIWPLVVGVHPEPDYTAVIDYDHL